MAGRAGGAAVRLLVLCAGVCAAGHFLLSLVTWWDFYVFCYRNQWREVLTVSYGLRHVSSAVFLLVWFVWVVVAAWRRRGYAGRMLVLGVLISAGVFAVEVRGEPQFQRVWFDHPNECSNRESHYCTWFWWQPRRH